MRRFCSRRLFIDAVIVFVAWTAVLYGCGTEEQAAATDDAAPDLGGEVNDAGSATVADSGASKGLGSPCDVLTDAGSTSTVFNTSALECPSFICLKPAVQTGAPVSSTGAYCSTSCQQDSDCAGLLADPSNPTDRRCQTGFVCGVPFVKGRLCCQKLCLCKDFLGPAGAPVPLTCQGDAAANCQQVNQ
jgi:hypothetical protein